MKTLKVLLTCALLLLAHAAVSVQAMGIHSHGAIQQEARQAAALHHLFQALDKDGDGQIESDEASRYLASQMGSTDLGSAGTPASAAKQLLDELDGMDRDETVSESELQRSLSLRLPGTTVEQWVHDGLGLPQYSAAFAQNGVTVLDFPLLLEDESLLETDLGIASKLHRKQIARAMRSVILGLGSFPAPVRNVAHEDDREGFVTVSWAQPDTVSHPPIKSIVIERMQLGEVHWHRVSAVGAHVKTYHDTTAQAPAAQLRYRVTSWSSLGMSESRTSSLRVSPAGLESQWYPDPASVRPTEGSGADPWGLFNSARTVPPAAYPTRSRSSSGRAGPAQSRSAEASNVSSGDDADVRDDEDTASLARLITGGVLVLAATLLVNQILFKAPSAARLEHVAAEAVSKSQDGIKPDAASDAATPAALQSSPDGLRSSSARMLSNLRRGVSAMTGLSAGDAPSAAPAAAQALHDPVMGVSEAELLSVSRPAAAAAAASARHTHNGARSSARGRTTQPNGGSSRFTTGSSTDHLQRSVSPRLRPTQSTESLRKLQHLSRRGAKVLNRCNMDGCHNRPLSLMSVITQNTTEFHYCVSCQRAFCVAHMGYVSHAKVSFGTCPLDASCRCLLCWAALSLERQATLRLIGRSLRHTRQKERKPVPRRQAISTSPTAAGSPASSFGAAQRHRRTGTAGSTRSLSQHSAGTDNSCGDGGAANGAQASLDLGDPEEEQLPPVLDPSDDRTWGDLRDAPETVAQVPADALRYPREVDETGSSAVADQVIADRVVAGVLDEGPVRPSDKLLPASSSGKQRGVFKKMKGLLSGKSRS